jgi:hypothetical protein
MDKLLFPGALLSALIAGGCALLPAVKEEGPDRPSAPRGRELSRGELPAERPPAEKPEGTFAAPPHEGLPWEGLPPGVRAYLTELAEAFARQDASFLLAQGEAQFEAEVRPRYDEGDYLALLYRAGPYGEDSPRSAAERIRLEVREISGVEYTGWEERGPLLEIRGRLIRRGGPPVPCVIMLVWKLWEPKILGIFP